MQSTAQSKASLRKSLLTQRKAMPPDRVAQLSRDICLRAFEAIKTLRPRIVASYRAIYNEVDPSFLESDLKAQGTVVAYPIIDHSEDPNGVIRLAVPKQDSDWVQHKWGIWEPRNVAREKWLGADDVEMVLVPGVGFEQGGHRLGYGKGHYDRFLGGATEPLTKVALAYDFQIATFVADAHDIAMDLVVTETGAIKGVPRSP